VFVVLSLERRLIVHVNVTAHPYAEWAAQQIVEAFGHDGAFKILIRDRDKILRRCLRPRASPSRLLCKRGVPIASPMQTGRPHRVPAVWIHKKDERPDIPTTAAGFRSEEHREQSKWKNIAAMHRSEGSGLFLPACASSPSTRSSCRPLSDGRHRSIQRSAHRDGIEPRTREEARVTVTLLAMSVKAAHLRSEENKEQSK
jgi:hypothetical protein